MYVYDYHYNPMKKHFGDNLRLMFTDIDSLIYHIKTDNFYNDLLNKKFNRKIVIEPSVEKPRPSSFKLHAVNNSRPFYEKQG